MSFEPRRSPWVLLLPLLFACGAPVPDYVVREDGNGLVLKLKHLEPVVTSDGEPALYLVFHPEAPIDDVEAVRAEVFELWRHFQPEVQRQGLPVAILRASTLAVDGWKMKGEEVQYVFRRRSDGSFRPVHDVAFAAYARTGP